MISVEADKLFLILHPYPEVKYEGWLSEVGARKTKNGYRLPNTAWNRDKLEREVEVDWLDRPDSFEKDIPEYDPTDLFDYQVQGVDFLLSRPWKGALLNFSQGLGKTLTVLRATAALKPKNVLISVTRPLHFPVWVEQADQWIGQEIHVKHLEEVCENPGWVVTNVGTLRGKYSGQSYQKVKWDVLIVDESSGIKHRESDISSRIKRLRERSEWCFLLSGTPAMKHWELWHQLHVIWRRGYPSFWRFAEDFCYVRQSQWGPGKEVIGDRTHIDMNHALRDIIYTVDHEALGLPDYEVYSFTVELPREQRRIYNQIRDDFVVQLQSGKTLLITAVISQYIKLMQAASSLRTIDPDRDQSAKTEQICKFIEEGNVEFPCLIWNHWVAAGDYLEERLKKVPARTARVTSSEDWHLIDSYRRGEIDILQISLEVGQEALHLVNTKTVFYHDRTFDLEGFIQSLYRVRRIGLKHSPKVYIAIARHTVDQHVQDNLFSKSDTAGTFSNRGVQELLAYLQEEQRQSKNL